MFAYQLLPQLIYLTLTVDNTAEYWEEKLEFVGTGQDWANAENMEERLLYYNC